MQKPKPAPSIEVSQISRHSERLPLPRYMSEGSAGLDLMADLTAPLTLAPLARALIPTGLKLALPSTHEAQVRPRSGLALRHGITVLNSPGTIDSDYRGEISVILINLGDAPFEIQRGDRIAQLVIAPVTQVQLHLVSDLEESERGQGGFGSTGV